MVLLSAGLLGAYSSVIQYGNVMNVMMGRSQVEAELESVKQWYGYEDALTGLLVFIIFLEEYNGFGIECNTKKWANTRIYEMSSRKKQINENNGGRRNVIHQNIT